MRVGIGYDSHEFDSDRPLVLGGVRIPGHEGLGGHSDGDAATHAVTDALLGAAGLGDIGEHFPDTDPDYEGISSLTLLSRAVRAVERENYQVVNVDLVVVTETPRIGPHREGMRERLAERLHLGPGHVSVKGKRNEGLGWIGRGEGLAAMAVVLLDRIASTDQVHATLRAGG